jgi:hypothetical protein
MKYLYISGFCLLKYDNNTTGIVQSWFEEYEGELQHFSWPAQLSDLNIIEPHWSVSESRVRYRFLLPTSLKQLKDIQEE